MKLVNIFTLLMFASGCSTFYSGPRMMANIGEGAMSIGTTLAAKMNPKDMTAASGGAISDPRFTFKGHISSGVIFDFTAQLVGADLDYDIQAGGQGTIEADPVIIALLTDIWGRTELNEEERRKMFAEAITKWMESKIK